MAAQPYKSDITVPQTSGPGELAVYRSVDGSEIAVLAPTWKLNPKITFESLADEFKRNPVLAWRNFGCEVSLAVEGAFKDPAVVLQHVNVTRPSPWDDLRNTYQPWFRGRPGVRYFMHVDLSKSRDATGIAMVHREPTGVVVIDFMLRVPVPFGRDINYGEIRERYIYPLPSRGFHLELVTFDQFQSAETAQVLQEKGFSVDYVSVDKSTDPYDTVIEMVLTNRLDYYQYPVFIREMEELRLVGGTKYDHPRKFRNGDVGSKDVADAVAGATYSAIQYELANPREPAGMIRVRRGLDLSKQWKESSYL